METTNAAVALDFWNVTVLPLLSSTNAATENISIVETTTLAYGFKEFTRGPFRLVQSSTGLVFHVVSLYIMFSIARRLFKTDMSIMLKTFLALWVLVDFLCIVSAAFITFWWRPVFLSYYGRVSSLAGSARAPG